MTTVTTYLFGESRIVGLRVILLSLSVALFVFLLQTLIPFVEFSQPPASYLFFVGVLLLAAINASRNNGLVVSVLVAWVLTGAAVAGGSFAGFHTEPTVWERYVVGPAIIGLGFGGPVGVVGYVLGLASRVVRQKTSGAQWPTR